jgi:probable rRNA maturation factor
MSPGDSMVLYRALPNPLRFSKQEKQQLRSFARLVSSHVADGRSFNCLVTNDRELQRLNREFLGHDYPTDVLSFPEGTEGASLGELAISVERAAAQAAEFGHECVDEVRILMLHGLLHLTGMDHERDRGEMARAERRWRLQLSLPATLIARNSATRGVR